MRMNNFREAPLIRAHFLINQEKSKKGYKAIQPEIAKMIETFGTEFDRSLHKYLFEEIEFKEVKSLLNSKNSKTQFFIQEFPQLVERSDFVSFFSEILMSTENQSTTQEIFDGLNKMGKLTYENQIKILISFIFSGNERFEQDANKLLISKCKEIQKEGKIDQLSQSTIQDLIQILGNIEDNQQDSLELINFIQESQSINSYQDEIKQLNDIEKILDVGNDEPIEIEKLFNELGPLMINNMISANNCELLSYDIDEKRLASFILFLTKNQNWSEDKENKQLNKIFLKTIECDAANKIDDSTNDKKNVSWNIDNFYKMFKKNIDQMDKTQVINALDDPKFSIKDKKTFDYFINLLQKLKILNDPLEFFNFIFTKWNNESNQIEFLSFLINNSQGYETSPYSFTNYKGKKVRPNVELSSTNITYQKWGYLIDAWSTIGLYEILFKLSKGNYYMQVKELFDWPSQNIPEIIILALTEIKPEKDEFLFYEITQDILPNFLTNHNNNFSLIEEVWGQNKELIIETLCTMYNNQPDLMNLSKILDITQKIKESLLALVNCKDYYFSVNLGILAAKRDFLHLEKWVKKRVSESGDDFIEALLNYIQVNLLAHCKGNVVNKDNILEKAQLSLESLAIILENLLNELQNSKISERIKNEIKEVYKSIFENFDKIQIPPVNPDEIENIANNLFHSMFNDEITVDDLIKQLITYQKSKVIRESEIFACIIHCVLDEYKFYHQYPEKELRLSATLFGQIINHKLISGIIETIALKYILEGIKKEGAMFNFGTIALSQFVDKIQSWPSYLVNLMEIPQIKNAGPLYEKLTEKYNESVNNNIICPIKNNNLENIHINSNNNIGNNINDNNTNISNNNNNLDDKKPNFNGNYSTGENEKNNEDFNKFNNQLSVNTPIINSNNNNNNNSCLGPANPANNLNNSGINNTINDKVFYNNNNNINNNLNSSLNNISQSNFNNNINHIDNKERSKTKLVKSSTDHIGTITQMFDTNSPEILPPQEIIEKMKFIFNTMSQSNAIEKSKELKNLLVNETNNKWFSNFFITNRVCAEINNHPIYNELIKLIDNKDLNKLLIKDTINFIKKILNKESIDQKEKNVLKNLGSWLGIMTLDKNKPIFAKDLDLKEIIFDAYEKGKLSIIITFVIKILEHSQNSKVFHTKNPWIQALLSVLFDISSKTTLKTTIKMEISSLFKKLGLDTSTYKCTNQLDHFTVCANSPDFMSSTQNLEQPNIKEVYSKISKLDAYLNNIMNLINSSQNSNNNINKNNNNTTQNNSNNNNNNKNLINRAILCEILTKSLCLAIKEIINPVIERAVNISVVTTRELTIKDFTFDNDENKFKNAAIYCIKSLSGSLAMVTCKEPLRLNFNAQLKTSLKNKKIDDTCIESIVNQPSLEIIDIGCNIIHESVIERAVKKLQNDNTMTEEINKRKINKSRDEEKKEFTQKIKSLPNELKPLESGLSDEQFKIYEIFDKIYESHNKNETNNKNNYLHQILRLLKEITNSSKNQKNYELCMNNIQILYNKEKNSVSDDEEQIELLETPIKESKIDDPNIILLFAKFTFKYLINASNLKNSYLINVYSQLIKAWASLNNEVSVEITNLLFSLDDIFIKFKPKIHYYFIKKKIFDFPLYEKYLCEYLNKDASCELVRKLLIYLNNSKVLTDIKFTNIPSYIFDNNKSENYFSLFSKNSKISGLYDKKTSPILDYKILNIKDQANYKKYYDFCFFYAYNPIYEKMFDMEQKEPIDKLKKDISDILDSLYLNTDERMIIFFTVITEFCIKGAAKDYLSVQRKTYFSPENEANYIYKLLCLTSPSINKLKMFYNVLNGIYKTFHYDYIKNGRNFNQRPYYKLIYNFIYLLDEYNDTENILNSDYKKINYLLMLADFLILVNPNIYPGFALAWLDLISSYHFIRNFFDNEKYSINSEDISKYEKYLFLIFYALEYLKNSTNEIISDFNSKIFLDNIYKFMFLLCNSYPELISSYYYIIVNSLPDGNNYIQMKNLILNCCPRDIEIVDPFTEELKQFKDIFKSKNANILFDTQTVCNDSDTKTCITKYLETNQENYLDEIIKKLNSFSLENPSRFHLIYAIVIYCSHNLLKDIDDGKVDKENLNKLFMKLLIEFDKENRDHLINSILNELRYPCIQTYYFTYLIIYLFSQVQNEEYDEHILKNLLERLMYYPRPWGIVYSFSGLLKNEKYLKLQKNYISDKNLTDVLEILISICKNHKNINYFSSN